MSVSFKKKIIFTNAAILVLFVVLLTYSAIQIVQVSSQNQFEEIKESITGNNKKLLLTFVKAQSVSLDKEVELITEEVDHLAIDFAHDFVNESKNEALRNKQLAHINTKLKPFVKEVRFIDTERNQEVSITENGIVSRSIFVDLSRMIQYKNYHIEKRYKDNSVTKFSIYIRPEHWDNALLKFDVKLEYFSRSLTFENMIDEFQYRYFLVDDSGKLVTSNLQQNVEQLMSESVFDEPAKKSVASHIMSHNLGSFVVRGDKGVFNVTFVKNSQTGWRLILVTPEHVIRSSYATTKELVLSGDNSLIKSLFFAYTLLLCLFLAINSIAVNRMLVPISKLIAQAQYLKQRDFNKATHTVHSNGDEIEQLSKAYSEAGVQIQNLIEGLEYEVEERTKQYEIAAQEASEANKQKSVLLSNVSHEVRTPLNAIIGYTHMLTHSKNFDDYSHQLKGISSASNTILGIVNDLLDFERVKAASYSLNPRCLSVMSLMREIENTFLPLSESKQLSLDIICNVDASTTLMIDELRIKQAISNIVSNALKFTNKGGVTIEVSTDDKAFNISVSDTGVGIPQDKLDAVFNGFEQVNQEDQQFGFGLGLAITKTIVELMKGSLRVESVLGTGSTFVISLPAQEIMDVLECSNGVAEQAYNVRERLDCTSKKALIVDDVEFNREILEFHLNALGCVCMTANDGLEALALVSEHEFDVVLTDISMPVMDGIELASELEKRKPSLPIIAVTARATMQEESRMNQYFSCYLTKPLNPSDLKLKLYCALSGGTC
ncbi:hybrid sensor histidine kinase/response regulator [Vibrio splendidus]|uniref:histidine kinase n=1 Tax=Vibrio lentus TaxID=136468 RepID=A0A855IM75_9VIBR|nr:ATP-binding protein [Vibrio lentus]PHN85639.1 hybrid sensor histidine kinase/response regulator [Vibrio splendidus]MCB5362129.1 response regulator [Vibrio lentus]MCB5452295.1 response regulator [Vibrio lentus]MCB5464498.1 response regulator [Vibrio lentus]MCC4795108.1 response regulator [Vibrio lentus]